MWERTPISLYTKHKVNKIQSIVPNIKAKTKTSRAKYKRKSSLPWCRQRLLRQNEISTHKCDKLNHHQN